MSKVEIIGFPQSTYVRAVRMVCEEKSIAYDLKLARSHAPEVNAIHPFGKVPVMRHDGLELFESKAIATYLDVAFPGIRLIPTEPRAAAQVEQWVSLVNTRIDPTMIRAYFFPYALPKSRDGGPDRAVIEKALPDLKHQVVVLDEALGKSANLAGKDFTFADINLTPIIFYVMNFPEGKAAIARAKNLSAWYERNAARPSFLNTMPPPPPS